MTPELYALAYRATTLPGWEWRPGMRYLFATGKLAGKGLHLQNPGCTGVSGAPPDECVPDLDDDATAGAMLGLLAPEIGVTVSQQAHGCSAACPQPILRAMITGRGATLGEAVARLVVARGGWR